MTNPTDAHKRAAKPSNSSSKSAYSKPKSAKPRSSYQYRRQLNAEARSKYRLFTLIPILIALVIAVKYKQNLKQNSIQFPVSEPASTMTIETLPVQSTENVQSTEAVPTSDVPITLDTEGHITNPEEVKATIGYLPTEISHTLDIPEGAEVATFAAGCFWGVESIFRRRFGAQGASLSTSDNGVTSATKRGLIDARVGYSGGYDKFVLPTYKQVCTNTTQHAEVLQISYDPKIVSYADLVDFFFRIHDPTTIDQQGPDDFGTQYRSAIFTHSDEQDKIAHEINDKFQKEWYDPIDEKIVTKIQKAKIFWDAEDYHQLYLDKNEDGYKCPSHFIRTEPPKKKA